MRNTRSRRVDGRVAWPFRPTIPDEPNTRSPEAVAAWEKDRADLQAMYADLQTESNRSDAIRRLMLDGYRARQENWDDVRTSAAIGKEFQETFPGLGAGQVAKVVDVLLARLGSVGGANIEPTPNSGSTAETRRTRISELAADLPEGDILDGELG